MISFIIIIGFVVLIGVFVIIAGAVSRGGGSGSKAAASRSPYKYTRRGAVMTSAEASFYQRLLTVAGDRYYVFPQIHLDALLDHKVKGQNWRGALSTIQRKSVDYVLCDKQSMRPMYAVELDGGTHDTTVRRDRDALVEGMLADAGLPLVRFRNVDSVTDDQIVERFEAAARA